MEFPVSPSPHVVAGFTVPRVMFQVLLALVPVLAVQVYLFGPGPLGLVATAADLPARGAEVPCIRCGDCATVCPVGLLPQQLHRAAQADDAVGLARFGLADCIECGCCDYVCPSSIPLTARFHASRERRQLHEAERLRATEARRRYERHRRRLDEQVEAERRAFEEARRRARGDGAGGS